MAGASLEQLHRTTLGIYESLLGQFNPNLQRLVTLGHSYVQAFHALASISEEYFTALGRMGNQALHTLSSHSLGDVIIQIAESQRRLTNELDGMFRWFHGEVLRDMENNVKLDKDFITGSRRRYEMEVRNQVAAQERQQRRGGPWDGGEQAFFLQQSQRDALMEEERRYRFLAEKHCHLSQNIAQLMNKTGGGLQRRAEEWTERVGATRAARPRTPSREQMGMREEQWTGREEVPLGRVPSRGPSPQPTRSRSSSVGDGLAAGRLMRAKVNHAPSGNPTILDFNRDDIIVVLIQQPRNGWLYGRGEHGNRQGWFPAAYVEPLDQAPPPPPAPAFTSQSMRSSHSMSNHHDQSGGGMRTSHSMSNLLDQSGGGNQAAPPPPAPPPPSAANQFRPISSSADKSSERQRKPKSENHGPRHELFPKGTNPFATVKLKPTVTNDRSAPKF